MKRAKQGAWLEISTSDHAVSARLGGLSVGANSQSLLEEGLDVVSAAILQHCVEQRSVTRQVLNKLVRDELGARAPDKKITFAMIGRCLRFGQLDSQKVAAISGEAYRILIHSDRIQDFEDGKEWVWQQLHESSSISVPEIETHLFAAREYNSWSACLHLIASMVYAGRAEFIDQSSCQRTPGLEHAFRDSH